MRKGQVLNNMNLYFDCEFTGLHKDTTLISLGIISEDGRELYAEFTDFDMSQCDSWIKENVLKNLRLGYGIGTSCSENSLNVSGDRRFITRVLKEWLAQFDEVQFVSDVCHYDFVLLIDLFGTAFDLPENVNAACHDINQDIAEFFNVPESYAFDMSREEICDYFSSGIDGAKHNALYDAKVIRNIFNGINEMRQRTLKKETTP